MTFVKTGIAHALIKNASFTIINTTEPNIPPEEIYERRRQALLTDLLFTGTNAVTERGQLINSITRSTYRVGAILYLVPKYVVVLIGRNKIVPDLDYAISRIKNYASPINAMRRKDKKLPGF